MKMAIIPALLTVLTLTASAQADFCPKMDELGSKSRSLAETILTDGVDYEILCAVPPSHSAAFESRADAAGILVHRSARPRSGNAPPEFKDSEGPKFGFRAAILPAFLTVWRKMAVGTRQSAFAQYGRFV